MDSNLYLNNLIIPTKGIAILFLLTVVNFFVSACEQVIESFSPFFSRLNHMNAKDEAKHQFLIQNKKTLLAAHILLNRIIWIVFGIVTCFYLISPLLKYSANSFFSNSIIGIVVFFNLMLSELIPKEFVYKRLALSLKILMPFIKLIHKIMFLPVIGYMPILNIFNRKLKEEPFLIFNHTENEIKKLIESAEETGEIRNDEKDLLNSVFDFRNIIVRQIMTPRVDLHSVSVETQKEDLLKLIAETGRSRVPIYEETDDQIVGIIYAKDILIAQAKNIDFTLKSIARPAYFVHENKGLHELLKEFRTNRIQMAIVQDEFGGTAGIVTVEDIVEELVGEIIDEYDQEEFLMEKDSTGYLVDGKTPYHHLSYYLPYLIENKNFDTIGGYVFGLLGKKPIQGEKISDAYYEFEVIETEGRRISKLHIRPLTTPNHE